jgi:hypothetical protein
MLVNISLGDIHFNLVTSNNLYMQYLYHVIIYLPVMFLV